MSTLSGFTDQADRLRDERAEKKLVPLSTVLEAVRNNALRVGLC